MAEPQNSKTIPVAPKQERQKEIMPGLSLVKKLCIILTVISCLVYVDTLYNGYVLDDNMMISENSYVKKGINGIPELLVTPHLKGYAPNMTDSYRQLSLIMFAVEYEFFGPNPFTGHLFNVILFAGCVLMLFLFLHKLFDEQRISLAFITSLLFAVHPIHTEVVANIKSRDELLCFFFAFLSINLFINYARQGKLSQLISGTCCLFLSIISKETVFTFIGVIPLIFFFYKNENRKRSVYITIATTIVVTLFIIIRTIVINKYKADGMIRFTFIDNALVGAPSVASKIATAILILGHYLKLLFIPYPLICDYSYNSIPYVGFGDIWVLLSLAAYLALVICGVYRLFKNKKDPWAFGILFFLFTISLFTNIPFIIGATQADRLIFFASTGICLLIALAIEKLILRSQEITILRSRKALVLFAICFVYAVVAVSRNMDWKDGYTLYLADVAKSPDNTRLYAFVGTELQRKYEEEPDPEKKAKINNDCILYLKKSLVIYPGNAQAHAELGSAYLIGEEYDSSILHFKRAIELDTERISAITNLGTLYSMQGKFRESIPYFKKSVALEPVDTQSWFNLAISYMQIQNYDSAIYAFSKTIILNPAYNKYASFANVAVVYKMMEKMDSAKKYETIARQYYPLFSLDSIKIR